MRRKKQPYRVKLSKRTKTLGLMISFGFVLALFGFCWTLIAAFMNNNRMIVFGLFMIGIGVFDVMFTVRPHATEYNKCVANSLYTTILWNEKNDVTYIIVQNGHGNIIEVNNMPVKQTFQTSGRYKEKMGAEVRT